MAFMTYKLIEVLEPNRIILGTKRGFDNDVEQYKQLEEDLRQDWQITPPWGWDRDGIKNGELVLVSSKMYGFRRGIVQNKLQMSQSGDKYDYYAVFLYDEGHHEDVRGKRLKPLKDKWKNKLPQRTFVVKLPGVTAGKPVYDLITKPPTLIMTQSFRWQKGASEMVADWLQNETVQYLTFQNMKTDADGSMFGDIIRKLKFDPNSTDLQPGEKTPQNLSFESLSDWLVEKQLAVVKKDLKASQLSMRTSKFSKMKKEIKDLAESSQNSDPVTSTAALSTALENGTDQNYLTGEAGEAMVINLGESTHYLNPPSNVKAAGIGWNPNLCEVPGQILIRGGKFVRPAYKELGDFQLPARILQAMEASGIIVDISAMHKIVAPNFIRGSDVIVVSSDGAKQHGKNMRLLSYILPVLRLIYSKYEKRTEDTDSKNCSPEAIIVVNSFNTGSAFESFIQSLLSFSQHMLLKVKFVGHDPSLETTKGWEQNFNKKRMLPRGVSILITTVHYLKTLLETNVRIADFLFDRLRFIVFEELELYLKSSWDVVTAFIEIARGNAALPTHAVPFQVALCGGKWFPEMEKLYHFMCANRSPLVIITAVNQALRYADLQWTVHHTEEETDKFKKLEELLTTSCNLSQHRVVISCNSSSTATKICDMLTLVGFSLRSITEDSSIEEMNEIREEWNSMEEQNTFALVIPDSVLTNAKISNATRLICFDSPELTIVDGVRRPILAERFGYVWSKLREIEDDAVTASSGDESGPRREVEAHFLLTGYEHNFQNLYKFGKSLGSKAIFPQSLEELAERMEQRGEEIVALCDNLKLFGYCKNLEAGICLRRHEILESDLIGDPDAPLTGEIEVRIRKCENPSQYSAQLLRHYVFQGDRRICNRSFYNDLSSRSKLLSSFYCSGQSSNVNNCRRPPESFEEGTWCAIIEPENQTYTRAKVVRILKRTTTNEAQAVRVFCVDLGIHLNPMVNELFQLPSTFREWPYLAVDLILSDLKPSGGEIEYRSEDRKKAKFLTVDKIYIAKVCLSINNSVWVNPMVEYHVDPETRQPLRGRSVRMELIGEKIAEFNRCHLENLFTLVRTYKHLYKGVLDNHLGKSHESDEFQQALKEFHMLGDSYRWAFVGKTTGNKFDLAKIAAKFGYNPWLFYGAHIAYEKELESLEKELDETIWNYIGGENDNQIFANHAELFIDFYQPDMIVAAKEAVEGRWMRAQILSKLEDEESVDNNQDRSDVKGPWFKIFFVDYGDTAEISAEDLFLIPQKFVQKLPFQAIALKLDHVLPSSGMQHWEEDEKSTFLDMIMPDSKGNDLEVLVFDDAEDEEEMYPVPCRYYNVVAFYNEKDVGSALVEQGRASWKPGQDKFVTDLQEKLLEFYNSTVNEAVDSDNDDEPDTEADELELGSDNFDFYMDRADQNNFLEMFGFGRNGFRNLEENAQLEEPPGRPQEVQQLPQNVENPTGDASGSSRNSSSGLVHQQPSVSNANITKSSGDKTSNHQEKAGDNQLHARVLWRQTETHIVLTILLVDIQKFDFRILEDRQCVEFLSEHPPNYGFHLKLYGKVTEKSINLTGQYLCVTLQKRMSGLKWRRLLFEKDEKYHWLKEELREDESEDEDAGVADSVGAKSWENYIPQDIQEGSDSSDDDLAFDLDDMDDKIETT